MLASAHCDAARDTLSSPGWHLSWNCSGVLACIALALASVVLALLPLLCRRPRQHFLGSFALHMLAPLPLLRWHYCPSLSGFFPLVMLLATHCHCRAGLFVGAALVSLRALRWHCHLCCADVVVLVTLGICPRDGAPPPASQWHLSPHAGGIALVVLVSAQLGAAFIIKISGLKKKQSKFQVFFFRKLVLGDLKSHPDGCRCFPPLTSPILSISFSSEINPLGISHSSLTLHALDSGFTVA